MIDQNRFPKYNSIPKYSTDGRDCRYITHHATPLCYSERYALVCFLLDKWRITVDVYIPTMHQEDQTQETEIQHITCHFTNLFGQLQFHYNLLLIPYELSLAYINYQIACMKTLNIIKIDLTLE